MALFVANNGQLQTIKGIYYGMSEDYVNATLFHNLVPKTATDIRFLYASNNPDLTDYQKIGYCDNNNFIEVWNNNGTKYILINPRKNFIYAPKSCYQFLYNYTTLTDCIFNNFDTRNTTSMNSMFYNCKQLTSLDLSNFNTQQVTSMGFMFSTCISLTSLDVSSFNTENVTNMGWMFDVCQNLTSLDVSNFNTVNVTSMNSMFGRNENLTSLDLSNFNTTKVTTMNYMFYQCYKLDTIFSKTFVLRSGLTSNNMFTQCTSLVGGNGTTYNSSHITAEYAKIDGEDGLPGYFTAPTN